MTVTPASLREKAAPIFDEVCDEDVQAAIDGAALYISETNWGSRYDDGIFYLAAHFLAELESLKSAGTIAGASATPSGAIKSEKIGDWAISYSDSGNSAFDNEALASTSWGRAFIMRRNLVFPARCF